MRHLLPSLLSKPETSDVRHLERAVVRLEQLAAIQKQGVLRLVRLGGADVLVDAMKEHRSAADLQLTGCKVLLKMAACSAESQAEVASKGGIEAVLGALRAHQKL